MKKEIHPEYKSTTITCLCGNVIDTRSTSEDIHLQHGPEILLSVLLRQKLIDTAGRVERFQRKYGDYRKKTGEQDKK